MRRAARVDGNQESIVADLRRIPGCTVAITSAVGGGFPDLIVGYRGFNFMFELKDASQPIHRHALTDDQSEFHDNWRGQVAKVFSFIDILNIMSGTDLR